MAIIWQIVLAAVGVAVLSPPLIMLTLGQRWEKLRDKRIGRRHPLRRGLLRPPGHTLTEEIHRLSLNAIGAAAMGPMIGFVFLLMLVVLPLVQGSQPSTWGFAAALAGTFLAACWGGWRSLKIWRVLQNKRLGRAGEMASAEELNKLMRQGYYIFHDVPGEKFNIDHVVVGPAGVFAVETKARTKRKRRGVKQDWCAEAQGDAVDYAGWRDDADLKQARRQGVWLSRWLTSATGESVAVRPVLSLPGWWVRRRARSDVLVINPAEAEQMIKANVGGGLDQAQIKRIAHQLDQRCRSPLQEQAQTSTA